MRLRSSIVSGIVFLVGTAGATAADMPARPSFDAEIRMIKTAIGPTGKIAKDEIYVFASPREANVSNLNAVATIEQLTKRGWTVVASVSCGYGPVKKGQTATYGLNSCDVKPLEPYAVRGNMLRAILEVRTEAGIYPLGTKPIKTYPPGPTFR